MFQSLKVSVYEKNLTEYPPVPGMELNSEYGRGKPVDLVILSTLNVPHGHCVVSGRTQQLVTIAAPTAKMTKRYKYNQDILYIYINKRNPLDCYNGFISFFDPTKS
jgi:hypothetical protein